MSPKSPRAVDRVTLDQPAKEALTRMMSELRQKEPCISLSPSSLGSLILSSYAVDHFDSEKEKLVRHFFNSREYLKNILRSSSSNENVVEALKAAIDRIDIKGRALPRGRPRNKAPSSTSALLEQSSSAAEVSQ